MCARPANSPVEKRVINLQTRPSGWDAPAAPTLSVLVSIGTKLACARLNHLLALAQVIIVEPQSSTPGPMEVPRGVGACLGLGDEREEKREGKESKETRRIPRGTCFNIPCLRCLRIRDLIMEFTRHRFAFAHPPIN